MMMKTLRYWFVAICIWFFFLYNVEKLGGVVNLATFVYIMTVVAAVLVILIPYLHKKPLYWSFLMAMGPYVILKFLVNSPQVEHPIPLIITEICAIGLSIMFSGKLARGLEEVQSSITSLTLGQLKQDTKSFKVGQGQLYREVRRARQYKRPITLLSIAPTENSKQRSLHRFIEDAQRAILDEYINARIANLLVGNLKDYDVITQRDDHFITLLPETDEAQAREVIKKLEVNAREELGLDFKIGYSTFPDEAVTFERLLEQAENKMGDGPQPVAEPNLQLATSTVNGVATH